MVFEQLLVCFRMLFHHALLPMLSFGPIQNLFSLILTSLLFRLLLPPKQSSVSDGGGAGREDKSPICEAHSKNSS